MLNAADNTTTKVQYIPFNGSAFIQASMIKSKGIAHGIATFKAYEGLYSQCLNGGMRDELSPTTAKHSDIAVVHGAKPAQLTATGKAFVKIADAAMAICKKVGKPKAQDVHDAALLEISALWAGCFKDAAPRVKSTEPTTAQKLASAEAALAAITIERDAAIVALKECQQALAAATAQTATA